MSRIYSLLLLILMFNELNGQTKTPTIFKSTLAKLHSLSSLTYSVDFKSKNPFSAGEISSGIKTVEILFNEKGEIGYKREETNINSGQTLLREIFADGKLYFFNLNDSTLTEELSKIAMGSEMNEVIDMMDDAVKKHPEKIHQLQDTLFGGRKCYSFLIKTSDTYANGKHNYIHRKVLIDKKSMMPIYFREVGEGEASKGGMSLGRLTFFNEKRFFNTKVNKTVVVTGIQPAGFNPPNTEMLNVGDVAPKLEVIAAGNTTYANRLNDQVQLVIFGATSCPANPLADPMLNRLHEKYSLKNFSIVNIYTNETTEQVNRYVESNGIKFPVHIGSRKLAREFKIVGTPNFYLVGGNGKIVSAYEGYSKSLEAKLMDKIDLLLNK